MLEWEEEEASTNVRKFVFYDSDHSDLHQCLEIQKPPQSTLRLVYLTSRDIISDLLARTQATYCHTVDRLVWRQLEIREDYYPDLRSTAEFVLMSSPDREAHTTKASLERLRLLLPEVDHILPTDIWCKYLRLSELEG